MVDCLEDIRELNRENAKPGMWIYESEIKLYWEVDRKSNVHVFSYASGSYQEYRKAFINSMNKHWNLTIIF